MKKVGLQFLLLLLMPIVIIQTQLSAQNIRIEDFEKYENVDSLKKAWRVFGYSSLDMKLEIDSLNSPIGAKYVIYNYSGNSQTTWGGALEMTSLAANPMDLSAASGIQFLMKGDNSGNKIYVRFSNGSTNWASQLIPVGDTTWQLICIPFVADAENGFTNGTATTEQMQEDLKNVTDLRVYIDHPTIDEVSRTLLFDEFYAVKFIPPASGIEIDNFEKYLTTDELKISWQGFGYSTLDYSLTKDPQNAALGNKYFTYVYTGDDNTTWGGAIRTKGFTADFSNVKAGIQFYMKGDGSSNRAYFRIASGDIKWGSYWITLEDTTWHLVKILFIADSLKGFRYLGTSDPIFYTDIGTTEQLLNDIKGVTEIRFTVDHPTIDYVKRYLYFDGFWAVDEFPPLPPATVDNFESYTDTDNLKLSWQQFGNASTAFALTQESDYVKEGTNAVKVSYKGAPSTTYTAIRKRNIIPGLNFSELNGGIQFWRKGDGSPNKIILRLFSGNEMWASNKIPLADTNWNHYAVPFTVDTTNGFRYLGNNPDNPVWSTDIGTQDQLMGNLSSIDQVRFDVRGIELNDISYTFALDKIEGVDKLSSDIIVSVREIGNENIPENYELSQNYPNPFNPTTKITYSIKKEGTVSLKVFNVLGQEVRVLFNGFQKVGNYEVSFDASQLASGVYIYRLSSGSFVTSKKMLLLK